MDRLSSKISGNVRLIAAADLHLGRNIPLPEVLKNYLTTPEGVWERLVDFIVDQENQVDALLLAGDLFDREENVLEAPYFFEKGLKRLSEANKKVIAIAGNHDWRSMKRRHRLLSHPGVYVLGLEDTWEHVDITFDTQTIRFEGWSFPSSEYKKNPLMFIPAASKDMITVGLLHGECDGSRESAYAPCSSKELIETGRQCWVLGHVHIPRYLRTDPPIFYCGSLQGLDPSEVGERGAFVIEIDMKGKIQTNLLPMASLLWQELVIDVTGIDLDDYETLLQKTMEKELTSWPSLKMIALQVRWKGEVREGTKARERLKNLQGIYFTLNQASMLIDCHVHTSIVEVKPTLNLALLAQEKTLTGLIAKQLIELEHADQQAKRPVLQKNEDIHRTSCFALSTFFSSDR